MRSSSSKRATSFPPGQVRIDAAQFLVNGGPVSLSPLKLPGLTETILPHGSPPNGTPGHHAAAGRGRRGKVAWVHQGKSMWCGRSSQAMLVNYWKPGTGADTFAFQNQNAHQLRGAESVRELTGMPYVGKNLSDLTAVAQSVEAGNPAIVYTKIYQRASDVADYPGHIIVLTGYDPSVNTAEGGQFYANDPYAKTAEAGTDVTQVGHTVLTKSGLEKMLYPQGANTTAIYLPPPAAK